MRLKFPPMISNRLASLPMFGRSRTRATSSNPSSTDMSYQKASMASQPMQAASRPRFPISRAIRAPLLERVARVPIRPADVHAEEVQRLGQTFLVAQPFELFRP